MYDDDYDENVEFEGFDDFDEDEKGYMPQRDDIVDYASYRRQQEEVGPARRDDDLDLPMGTEIEGGVLKDIMQRQEILYMDPVDAFKLDVQKFINSKQLSLDSDDKKIIYNNIKKIPMIEYKNYMPYILGYYIAQAMPLQISNNEKQSPLLSKRIRKVQQFTAEGGDITMFEIIKYARYWKLILLKD